MLSVRVAMCSCDSWLLCLWLFVWYCDYRRCDVCLSFVVSFFSVLCVLLFDFCFVFFFFVVYDVCLLFYVKNGSVCRWCFCYSFLTLFCIVRCLDVMSVVALTVFLILLVSAVLCVLIVHVVLWFLRLYAV